MRTAAFASAVALLCVAASVLLAEARVGRTSSARRESDPATFAPRLGEPLAFARACDGGVPSREDLVVVAAYGDVLLHNPAHRQGSATASTRCSPTSRPCSRARM